MRARTPDGKQYAKQQSADILSGLRFRYASVELTSLRASVKKALNLHQNVGDHPQKLAVVRSDFKRGIYQQAATPIFIAQRPFYDFVEKSLDSLPWQKIILETLDSFTENSDRDNSRASA